MVKQVHDEDMSAIAPTCMNVLTTASAGPQYDNIYDNIYEKASRLQIAQNSTAYSKGQHDYLAASVKQGLREGSRLFQCKEGVAKGGGATGEGMLLTVPTQHLNTAAGPQ